MLGSKYNAENEYQKAIACHKNTVKRDPYSTKTPLNLLGDGVSCYVNKLVNY